MSDNVAFKKKNLECRGRFPWPAIALSPSALLRTVSLSNGFTKRRRRPTGPFGERALQNQEHYIEAYSRRKGISLYSGKRLCQSARSFIIAIFIIFLFICGCGEDKPPHGSDESIPGADSDYEGIIVALGDSLTAGHGIEEEKAYPAMLEKKLQSNGFNYRVINAGISGETSSGMLSRIKWVISTLQPDVIILETGANDGLRGIEPDLLKNNLDKILTMIRQNDIRVVFTGMKMLPNLGPEYASAFGAIYPLMAERYDVIFMPFFLEGVAGDSRLNQEDGIHPNEEGYIRIVENIYPYVIKALTLRKEQL